MKREYCDIIAHKQIVLYGIGVQFQECYKLFNEYNLLLCDSDLKKIGKKIDENIIISPEELTNRMIEDSVVVITSIKNQYEIAQYLCNKMMISNDKIFTYTSKWYEDHIYNPQLIKSNWNRILSCADKLEDDESKKYYINSALARLTRNPKYLVPNSNVKVLGEYADKVIFQEGDQIIDCGAYTGDTAELYINKLQGDCYVYAIEPSLENYGKMIERISEKHLEKNVDPICCAVADEDKETKICYNENDFGMGMGLLKEDGSIEQRVLVRTLDSLFADKKITYIKMDVEGEEKAALIGGNYVIKNNKPRLMISGYHKVEDLWEIPETIWGIDKNYKIYVGHAPGVSMELEFYCTI